MPVLDQVAADYQDEVAFVAVAGRSSLDSSARAAASLFTDRLLWGYDEDLWALYGVRGQPTTFLITADNKVYEGPLYSLRSESDMRNAIEDLLAVHT